MNLLLIQPGGTVLRLLTQISWYGSWPCHWVVKVCVSTIVARGAKLLIHNPALLNFPPSWWHFWPRITFSPHEKTQGHVSSARRRWRAPRYFPGRTPVLRQELFGFRPYKPSRPMSRGFKEEREGKQCVLWWLYFSRLGQAHQDGEGRQRGPFR